MSSNNPVGYYRLFDTYNTATQIKTQFILLSKKSYNLNELAHSEESLVVESAPEPKQRPPIKCIDTKYIALQIKRIKLIQSVVEARKGQCNGTREVMCYLMYNAAMQVYTPSQAYNLMLELNKSFLEPLKSIDFISDYLNSHGTIYRFKNETFAEWLHITEEEQKHFNDTHISSNASRDAERAKNKAVKAEKKKTAMAMLQQKQSYKAIIAATGLSERTIHNLKGTLSI